MANEVFISYSRRDIETVKKIKKYIDEEVGIDCWFDLDGIESGEEFKRVITSAIDKHDTILFMKTSDSMRSKFVKKEIDYAESIGKRIILVDLDHTPLTSDYKLDFCSKDNIDWYDNVQRDKLIRNLKNWFPHDSRANIQYINEAKAEEEKNAKRREEEHQKKLKALENINLTLTKIEKRDPRGFPIT